MSIEPVEIVRTADGIRFGVRVIPRASRVLVGGTRDGRLLLRVTSAPVDGAANEAATSALAKALGVPVRAVSITAGATARNKTIEIRGLDVAAARQRLGALTGQA